MRAPGQVQPDSALTSHKDVLTAVFDEAPVGIGVCDDDGRLVAVNDSMLRLLGYRRDQVIGRPFLNFVHPAHRAVTLARYFEALVAAASGGRSSSADSELQCIAGDGAYLWVAVTWRITGPDRAGVQYGIIHIRDVGDTYVLKRELAAVQARLALAFAHSPIGIAMVDMDGRLIESNLALQSLLGYKEDELSGLALVDITHPADRSDAIAAFDGLRSRRFEVHQTARRYLHRSGRTIYARCIAAIAEADAHDRAYFLLQVEDITGERLANDRLLQLTAVDPLTGLASREALAARIELSRTGYSLITIVLADLAAVNDALGRAGVDECLLRVARKLSASCRMGDLLARTGGDEFGILVQDDSDGSAGTAVASRLLGVVDAPIRIEGNQYVLGARLGIANDSSGSRSLNDLHREARLGARWSSGRSRPDSAPPAPQMLPGSARSLVLESDLRGAVRHEALSLVYQPIVDVNTQRVVTVEALCRWNHPSLGAIDPQEFIALAEGSELIEELTTWSLDTACRELAQWRAEHASARSLAVGINISAIPFGSPGFVVRLATCLQQNALPPDRLILEITETALSQATETMIDNSRQVRLLGVRLALDDFGAGYSSLARMVSLPLSDLKLDRALTSQAVAATKRAALIRASVGLANDLGLTLVAEGIETRSQLDMVRHFGCHQAQGYFIGRPEPATRVPTLLANNL